MLKKILPVFTNSYFSLPVVILGLFLVLIFQYAHGGRIVYFLPDYPVTRDHLTTFSPEEYDHSSPYGGFDKCDWYGSCLTMANEVRMDYAQGILLLVVTYYALLAGLSKTILRKIISFILVGASYVLVATIQSLDWFYSCSDFCGIEYFFIWVVPVGFFIIGMIIAWRQGRGVPANV